MTNLTQFANSINLWPPVSIFYSLVQSGLLGSKCRHIFWISKKYQNYLKYPDQHISSIFLTYFVSPLYPCSYSLGGHAMRGPVLVLTVWIYFNRPLMGSLCQHLLHTGEPATLHRTFPINWAHQMFAKLVPGHFALNIFPLTYAHNVLETFSLKVFPKILGMCQHLRHTWGGHFALNIPYQLR